MLSYDVIIATRNRPHALSLSIPLWIGQVPQPTRLIIADSSDDHANIKDVVDKLTYNAGIEVIVLRCSRGLTRQRNAGLAAARSEIVMFPDDDALPFSGVAREILKVYELDVAEVIGAVCAAWADQPPRVDAGSLQAAYKMTVTDRIKLKVSRFRQRFENAVCPNPFILLGRDRWSGRPVPSWLPGEDVVQVEWMTGLCMTFRKGLLSREPFDETLEGYGLFEDVDASFTASRQHLIVGVNRAKLFHYRMPGKRGNGREMGATQLLNRAYVVCKHSEPSSSARRALRRYGLYKALLYALQCHTRFGRARLAGAWAALCATKELNSCLGDELQARYRSIRDRIIR